MRWHAHYHSSGTGPLYQGRFKSFPVQEDDHLFTVCRYVERNPLRAAFVSRAQAWPWSSLARRLEGRGLDLLDTGPLPLPESWLDYVNGVETAGRVDGVASVGSAWCAVWRRGMAAGDGAAIGAGEYAEAFGASAQSHGGGRRGQIVFDFPS